MFRHQMCHSQGPCFVTLLNYVSTIAVLARTAKLAVPLPTDTTLSELRCCSEHKTLFPLGHFGK